MPQCLREHVQPAIELQLRVDVEIGVDLEKAAGLDLVQTAAAEVRIRNQPFDPRERFQPQKHLKGAQVVEKVADRSRDAAGLVVVAELLLHRRVEGTPRHPLRAWKLAQDGIERGVVEQTIEDDVRERLGSRVLVAELESVKVKSQRCHSGARDHAPVRAKTQSRHIKSSGASSMPYTHFLIVASPGPSNTSATVLVVRSPTT